METGTTSWLEHVDMIPTLLKWLMAVISSIGGTLCGIIWYLGKQFVSKVNTMDAKLDHMQHIMLMCDGCSDAARRYGRRADDLHIGEDDITA